MLTTTLSHVEWVGGSVVSSGFPTVREPHRPEGNRGIEAFGNDRVLEVWKIILVLPKNAPFILREPQSLP